MPAPPAISCVLPLLDAQQNVVPILVWSGVLMAAVVLLFAAAMWAKKWAQRQEPDSGGGFTLADLRDLHRRGQMTSEEYERARAKIVASARATATRQQDLRDRRAGAAGDDL